MLIDMLLVSGRRKDNECFTAAALAKVNSTINRRSGMDILRVRCHKCARARCRLPSEAGAKGPGLCVCGGLQGVGGGQ